jgi:nucleotidyltransferase substrate binding protein (TIGR01987 family)
MTLQNTSSLSLRTIQRYQTFKKAFARFEEIINLSKSIPEIYSEISRDSIIQRFEFTLEMIWNLQKDMLTDLGHEGILGPRPALQKAFEIGLIDDFEIWKDMLKSRNLTSHTYNERSTTKIANDIIIKYYPQIQLFIKFIESNFNWYEVSDKQ